MSGGVSSAGVPGPLLTGPGREALREKGQFWTPDWVADAMVAYAVGSGSDHLFDPAVGAGAFLRAARRQEPQLGRSLALLGSELYPEVLEDARRSGLTPDDLREVEVADFLRLQPRRSFRAITANPPYIRHHRLPPELKAELRAIGRRTVGRPLDGRAGLHIFFLLHALELLDAGGRLAFIMPADSCEGVFAPDLWRWITARFRLDAVITFSSEATPFPQVDTNPIIYLISGEEPRPHLWWARCRAPDHVSLHVFCSTGCQAPENDSLVVEQREIGEALSTGLSRPRTLTKPGDIRLGDCARVLRGIASGANAFFFLTRERARELHIPREFLLPAVGRTRDVPGHTLDEAALDALDRRGRPTLLFAPDGRAMHRFSRSVRNYLEAGEAEGIHTRSLLSTRNPWYRMERRAPPPLLFAYLGRRNTRFILNQAEAVPLSNFSCLYPRRNGSAAATRLWRALQHPDTLANLSLVGKSYGSGAIKVEPRSLEQLRIPAHAATAAGLPPPSPRLFR